MSNLSKEQIEEIEKELNSIPKSEKQRINSLAMQFKEDEEILKKAFETFSNKYQGFISGFTIVKYEDFNWRLMNVVMNGKLYRHLK